MTNLVEIQDKKQFSDRFQKINLDLHGVRLPKFIIEKKFLKEIENNELIKGYENDKSSTKHNYEFLKALCRKGLEEKDITSKKNKPQYAKRLNYELKTLKELGFTDYILLVWKVVNFCKEKKIPLGLGRGSAAGSFVLFLLGVTNVDPVKYNLFFERFVSKIRAKKKEVDGITYLDGSLMCDVDMDVCYYRRGEVLKYLEQEFTGKTSKIRTLNTLSGKLVMKECGKVVEDKTEIEMNSVSSLIPKVFGQVKDLEETYEEEEKFQKWCDRNKKTFQTALKLKGLIKNKGVHPSGILLSHGELTDTCPIERASPSEDDVISCFDMNWVSLSNVKLDVLGLRTVSVVDQACKLIGKNIEDIDLDDEKIYQHLYDLKRPQGIFQIEADANFKVCQKVKPKNLEELSAVLALARPGAMQFVDQYANYTNNDVYEPIHPLFDEILGSTGGVALYQEQLMQMAHKIGFTLDEAEVLRRIVGKKKVQEVKKWKKKIDLKIKQNKLSNAELGVTNHEEVGDVLWTILEDSANYSFNKSHSIAYASLAALTTYLKFNHPKEFFISLLKMTRFEPDPIQEISKIHAELSCEPFNMTLLPPNLIKSKSDFSIEEDSIRFGLTSIKGISEASIEKLDKFRDEYSNKFDIFEASVECGINLGVLSALIQAGVLETNGKYSRSKVVAESQLWKILTERERLIAKQYSLKGHDDLIDIVARMKKDKNDKGKPHIKESRINTLRNKFDKYVQIYKKNKSNEEFANWYYENALLGYTYGKSIKDIFSEKRTDLVNIRSLEDLDENENVTIVGIVEEPSKIGISKKGTKYLKFTLKDETGSLNILMFNSKRLNAIDLCKSVNKGSYPDKKNIVLVSGVKKEDCIFAEKAAIQDSNIYMKLADLKQGSVEDS